jgi:hypothetical protein
VVLRERDANGMNDASALPAWLQEILPAWFTAHPAFTEAAYAFGYSALLGMGIVASGGAQQGAFSHGVGPLCDWLSANWWQLITAGIAAGLRSQRAYSRVVALPANSPKGTP